MSDQAISHLSSLILLPPASVAAVTNSLGTGVDVSGIEGNLSVSVVASVGTGTLPTLDMKFQTCATLGGTYTDIAGAAILQVAAAAQGPLNAQNIAIDKMKCSQFVRSNTTTTGTTPVFVCAATIIGDKKYF